MGIKKKKKEEEWGILRKKLSKKNVNMARKCQAVVEKYVSITTNLTID